MLNKVRVSWRSRLFLLTVVLSLATIVAAQGDRRLIGLVRDGSNDRPLVGVEVTIDNEPSIETDGRGIFEATINSEVEKIRFRKDGYISITRPGPFEADESQSFNLNPRTPSSEGVSQPTAVAAAAASPKGSPARTAPVNLLMLGMLALAVGILAWQVYQTKSDLKKSTQGWEDFRTRIDNQHYVSNKDFGETVQDLKEALDKLETADNKNVFQQRPSTASQQSSPDQASYKRQRIDLQHDYRSAAGIAEAYNEARKKNDLASFLQRYTYKRVGVRNADDRARNTSAPPEPEFAPDGSSGEYLVITEQNVHYLMPWFRPIDDYLIGTGALRDLFETNDYDSDNNNQKITVHEVAVLKADEEQWNATNIQKKGRLTFHNS